MGASDHLKPCRLVTESRQVADTCPDLIGGFVVRLIRRGRVKGREPCNGLIRDRPGKIFRRLEHGKRSARLNETGRMRRLRLTDAQTMPRCGMGVLMLPVYTGLVRTPLWRCLCASLEYGSCLAE